MTDILTPYIGCWIYTCCQRDLEQIKDQEALKLLLDRIKEDGEVFFCFPTEKEALTHILHDFIGSNNEGAFNDEIDAVNARLIRL